MGMQKARMLVEQAGGKNASIPVMFNPESYNISYGASYSEKKIPGLDGAISQYVSGESSSLDMTLYFDTYKPPAAEQAESGSNVMKETRKLTDLVAVDGRLHRPPRVTFCWGCLYFEGYVASVKVSYTMFLSDGMPVRAKADVTFRSLLNPGESRKKQPLESPDRTKLRVLKEKEQLWHLAFREYQDVECWREIAAANGIRNPLELTVGQALKLPPL